MFGLNATQGYQKIKIKIKIHLFIVWYRIDPEDDMLSKFFNVFMLK